jgi:hypothetical protein
LPAFATKPFTEHNTTLRLGLAESQNRASTHNLFIRIADRLPNQTPEIPLSAASDCPP